MAREIADKCDIKGCSQTRGPSNNWFMQFWSATGNIVIQAFNDEEAETDLRERVQKGEPSKYMFLCGEECVHKNISQNLGSLHSKSTIISIKQGIQESSEEKSIYRGSFAEFATETTEVKDDDIPGKEHTCRK